MTPQIFNDIKRIVGSGHNAKSARKATDEAINGLYRNEIAGFVTSVMVGIGGAAEKGHTQFTVAIPNLGTSSLESEVEALLMEHLHNRSFEITPHTQERKMVVRWSKRS